MSGESDDHDAELARNYRERMDRPTVLTPADVQMVDELLARRLCGCCHRTLPADAFPPEADICEHCYRLAGVDAWDDPEATA